MRFAFAVITSLLSGAAAAQACPEKNLLYWQAFPAGGESDLSARHQQLVLKKKCPAIETIIQYKPGAGGGLMWMQLNQLPGDGLNIAGINLPHIVLQPLEGNVQYKADDLQSVYWFHFTPDALIVTSDSPYKTLGDLLAFAKANPGKLNFGFFNASSQVPAEVLATKAGVEWQGVAYKAIGNAWTDLYAGAIQFMFVDLTAGRGQVVADKARPLAITLPERSPLYPKLPTLAETFPGFTSTGFLAIAVPKATPRPIEEKLNALINEAISSPTIHDRLINEFALDARPLSLEQCAAQDREERAKWAEYVKIARIEAQ